MKTAVTVIRAISIVAGLIGVAMAAVVLLAVVWGSGGGSGAGMVAYGLVLFGTPVIAVLTSIGFIGVLITRYVARRLASKSASGKIDA